MQWPINRRLFVLVPSIRLLFGNRVSAAPGGGPGAATGYQPGHAQGMEGNRYTSPTYGWSIDLNTDLWEVEEDLSDNGVDVLTLRGTDFGAPTAVVTFRASPPEFDTLEERMLQIRREEIPETFAGARITVGEDEETRPIYGVFNDEGTEEKVDDHWIASYVARFSIEQDPNQDWIIELDIVGLPNTESVLTINARSMPEDYQERAYALVEDLRYSLYENTQTSQTTRLPSMLSALRIGGGSRPRVQY